MEKAKEFKVVRTKQIISLPPNNKENYPIFLDTFVAHTVYDAVCKLEDAYKVDKALYDSVVAGKGSGSFTDEYYQKGKEYSFIVGNVKIECSVQGFDEIAESLYNFTAF